MIAIAELFEKEFVGRTGVYCLDRLDPCPRSRPFLLEKRTVEMSGGIRLAPSAPSVAFRRPDDRRECPR